VRRAHSVYTRTRTRAGRTMREHTRAGATMPLKLQGNVDVFDREMNVYKVGADGKRAKGADGKLLVDHKITVPTFGKRRLPIHTQAQGLQRAADIAENIGSAETAAACNADATELSRLYDHFYTTRKIAKPFEALKEGRKVAVVEAVPTKVAM